MRQLKNLPAAVLRSNLKPYLLLANLAALRAASKAFQVMVQDMGLTYFDVIAAAPAASLLPHAEPWQYVDHVLWGGGVSILPNRTYTFKLTYVSPQDTPVQMCVWGMHASTASVTAVTNLFPVLSDVDNTAWFPPDTMLAIAGLLRFERASSVRVACNGLVIKLTKTRRAWVRARCSTAAYETRRNGKAKQLHLLEEKINDFTSVLEALRMKSLILAVLVLAQVSAFFYMLLHPEDELIP
jgi:hypothetical protein